MPSNSDVRVALDAFRRIVQALRTDARRGDLGPVSHAQLFALQQIAAHPRSSINDVAALTFTHQSSVSVVVSRLVERRLVERVEARDDRRRQRLRVTALGRQVLDRAPSAVPQRLVSAISRLPTSARRAFAKSLDRIAGEVSPSTGGSPPMFLEGRAAPRRRSREAPHTSTVPTRS
jgi:DNA-binding MarR family transcriptional regulator